MNERVLNDVKPPRDLNPEISPELEEILYRALEREPRHRYATASEMMWDLEHQEQVGVEPRGDRPAGHADKRLANSTSKLLLYGALVVVPVVLFALDAGACPKIVATGSDPNLWPLISDPRLSRRQLLQRLPRPLRPGPLASTQISRHRRFLVEHLLRPLARLGSAPFRSKKVREVQISFR